MTKKTQTNSKLKKIVVDTLLDHKAENCIALDIHEITEFADFMIICSGTSNRHLDAMASKLVEASKKAGFKPLGVAGASGSDWVLVDLGSVVVHLMLPETRELYELEKLWDKDFLNSKIATRTKPLTDKKSVKKIIKNDSDIVRKAEAKIVKKTAKPKVGKIVKKVKTAARNENQNVNRSAKKTEQLPKTTKNKSTSKSVKAVKAVKEVKIAKIVKPSKTVKKVKTIKAVKTVKEKITSNKTDKKPGKNAKIKK
jgi:ribosome-associated protein